MSTICTKTLHFFFVSDVKNKDSTLLAILITKVHPNFGLVNKGVRPLLFTKPRISLNRDSVWYKKQLSELAFVH